ncbi:HAMP domain-containing histidine kinase [Aromatoleum toluclasticum]|uniref:sensor histidine kinase n=1 Tax=Aromatoleum toluclasticum TaxID=92003 RepID=UPI00036570E3|nr:HAMP domain-containing sensor histidine kinase [Aromatoleum toluclasticum]MCC4114464.1 HAMP domain-containing histidine kinase [Aromatoleum toluclasticum]
MLRRLLDLSIRHKLPIWGAALILASSLSVLGASLYNAYLAQREAVLSSADSLATALSRTIAPAMLHDEVWRAYELVRAPFRDGAERRHGLRPALAFAIDNESRVYVASDPQVLRMLSPLADAGAEFSSLARALASQSVTPYAMIEPEESTRLFVAVPIADGDRALGTLILAYSKPALAEMFAPSIERGLMIGLLALALLLPFNWYWGRRLATPLAQLARQMEALKRGLPRVEERSSYDFRDEVGLLFEAFDRMVQALREKALLEQGIVSAERLAAIGRLTAAIAHEINNPLAGMLTAVDTLKERRTFDERTRRTLGLVERGLLQVRDTVGALLVEARCERRELARADIEDLATLLQPAAQKARVELSVPVELPVSVPLPAAQVRQLLINLTSNAIQAAGEGGWVRAVVRAGAAELHIEVANGGPPIAPERMAHLFEPFVSYRPGGHGLGLWVTYQLVKQMEGWIEVRCEDDAVRFLVGLPLADGGPST